LSIKLDTQLLVETGLGALGPDLTPIALKSFYDVMEARVGTELGSRLSETQLKDFQACVDRADETGAARLLEAMLPDYREVVQRVFNGLKLEVATQADEILEELAGAQLSTSIGDDF
jgi:hypothetical protein